MKQTATLKSLSGNLGTSVKIILTLLFLNFFTQNISAQVIVIDGQSSDWNNFPNVDVQDKFNIIGVDNIFAGNEKDFFFAADWFWKLGTAKDKNDIANGAAMLVPDVDTGTGVNLKHLHGSFLAFAGDRISNAGDAQIGFWFFQDGTAPATVNGVNGFFPEKHSAPSPGDILVLADFRNGGRRASVTVLEWVGTGGTYPNSNNVFNQIGTNAAVAQNNGTTAPVPAAAGWIFKDKTTGSTTEYSSNEFYEGYVDLAIFGPGKIFCPSTYLLETRSTHEITAVLDDFIGGPLAGAPSCDITGNNTICAGSSTCFTASGGFGAFTYKWSGPGGVNVTNTTGVVCNLTAAGTYNVTVTNPTGCTSICSRDLAVNVTPSVTVNNASVCAGGSATLTASHQGGFTPTYHWNTGASTQSITVTPGATTTYNVTVSNGACSGTGSGTVTVNPNPTVTVNNASICAGSSTTLTATPSIAVASYHWNTGASTQTITVSPGATTTYNVTVTTAAGCSGTGSGTVTVNPNPTVTVDNASICAGTSTTLTATPNIAVANYHWNTGASTQTITVSPGATTTYNVTVTTAAGCSGSGSGTVTVNQNPTVTVNSVSICAGTSTTLTATPNIAVASYHWNTGASTQTITVSPGATTTYNVTVTTAAGCSGSGSGTVTINTIPSASVNNASICAGSSTTLTVTTNASGYLWSTGATTQTITVSPGATTTYNVTVTSGPGCTNTASGTVTVNPNPTVTVNNASICAGGSTTLTATPNIGVASYHWNTGASTQSITVTPGATTTYNVTVTTGAGCSGTGSGTVTVNPNPTVTVNSATICAGSSTTLTATPNIAVSSYIWSNGRTTQTNTVSPSSQTTYSVTVTTAAGCSGTGSGTVSLVPNASATSSNPSSQCRAASVVNSTLVVYGVNIFSVTGVALQGNPLWELVADNGYSVTIVSPNSLTTNVRVGGNKNGGTVTLRFSSVSNTTPKCADASVTVTLTLIGVPDVKPLQASDFCPNVTNVGSVQLLNSQLNVSYQLLNDNIPPNNTVQAPQVGTGGTLTWYNLPPDSYTVEGTFNGTSCSTTSGPATVVDKNVPDPSITPVSALCSNTTCVSLSGLPTGGTFSGTGVSGNQFCPAVAGVGTHTITYTVTNEVGCTASITTQIEVKNCAGTLCTYTQGYFGNDGGTSCDGTNDGKTTAGLIAQSLTNWGGTLTLGANGTCGGVAFDRRMTITNTPEQIACVIDKMPGGGPATELSGASTICSFNDLKNGRIHNVLLAQTLALGLNIGIGNPQQPLGDFSLQAGCLYTAKALECGKDDYTTRTCEVINGQTITHNEYENRCFSQALINVLTQYYTPDVSGVFALANDALGNKDCVAGTEHGLSLSEIAGAAGSINEVFDECRVPVGWDLGPCSVSAIAPPRITVNAVAEASTIGKLKVSAYPNPFRDQVRFVIQSPVAGQAVLEVYNVAGQKLQTLYNGRIEANETKNIEYKPKSATSSMMIYKLRIGNQIVSGKLVGMTD